MFSNLWANKIENIQKIIRDDSKPKPKIIMTTKGPSRKQVIVPMSNDNKISFMKDSSTHVTNLNRNLKNIKSEIIVDFICQETSGVTIVTNKVTSALNLQTIENYVKNANYIESTVVEVSYLPQSKSYLKITDISYLGEFTNVPIISDVVQEIFKKNHIFNNIAIMLKPWVIKVFPKSDMSIIWFNIWDIQNESRAKDLINRCFNVRIYIATIRGTNMNPGVF